MKLSWICFYVYIYSSPADACWLITPIWSSTWRRLPMSPFRFWGRPLIDHLLHTTMDVQTKEGVAVSLIDRVLSPMTVSRSRAFERSSPSRTCQSDPPPASSTTVFIYIYAIWIWYITRMASVKSIYMRSKSVACFNFLAQRKGWAWHLEAGMSATYGAWPCPSRAAKWTDAAFLKL